MTLNSYLFADILMLDTCVTRTCWMLSKTYRGFELLFHCSPFSPFHFCLLLFLPSIFTKQKVFVSFTDNTKGIILRKIYTSKHVSNSILLRPTLSNFYPKKTRLDIRFQFLFDARLSGKLGHHWNWPRWSRGEVRGTLSLN